MDPPFTAPENATSPGESRLGLNVLTLVAAIMVALALLLAFKGRDMYAAYTASRSVGTAEKAMKLIEEEHYEGASQLLQDGFRLTPDSPELNRVIAELFFRAYGDASTAISFLRKVLNSPEGTAMDRLRLAEILLASGEISEARRFYATLPAADQTGRKGLELLAGIKRQAGELAEADALLRRALTLAPDDLDAQLRLAILNENLALEQARDVSSEKVWVLARRMDAVALNAMTHLALSPTLKAAQARELKELVTAHPLAKDKHRYQVLRAYLRLHPLDRETVINAEADRTQKLAIEDKFDYLRWLGMEGEYERLIQTIPADAVGKDPDIFLIYVDGLTAAERWKELLAIMQAPRRPPVTAATGHLILAQCYAKLRPNLVDARRELALVMNASGKPELPVLMRAATMAESLHMYDLAIQGLKLMAQSRPALRIQMLERIYALQQGQRQAEGMVEVLRQLHELRPENAAYVARLNYLRLIQGMELETACEEVLSARMETVELEATTDVPAPLLRALAALRYGDRDRMKQEVAAITRPEALSAGHRAVVAGLYTLSGRDVEGYRLAEKVPTGLLLDGERRFLRQSSR